MLSTSQMSFNEETGTLVVEASTIGLPPGTLMRSYVRVQSEHTGKEMTFVVEKIERAPSGEVASWVFLPMILSEPSNVKSLVVLND